MVPGPLEQVLDKVEQARIRPVHVLEHHRHRVGIGQPFEEQSPGAEELLLRARLALLEPKQMRQPRLNEPPLLGIYDVFGQRRLQLGYRRGRCLVLRDPASHPHHVRQRPVRNPLAVSKAAAAMPQGRPRQPVHVLEELPPQPRLADSGDPGHRHEIRPPLFRRGVEQLLQQPQLTVAPHERCLQPLCLQRASPSGDNSQSAPQRHQPRLALQLEIARRLIHQRLVSRAPCRVSDCTLPGWATACTRDAVFTRSPALTVLSPTARATQARKKPKATSPVTSGLLPLRTRQRQNPRSELLSWGRISGHGFGERPEFIMGRRRSNAVVRAP